VRPGRARLIAALLTLCAFPMPARAQQPAAVPAVLVHAAEQRSLARHSEFVGRADAPEKVDVRARVRGYLGARLFQDGDPVKNGQTVFTIEKDTFEAASSRKKRSSLRQNRASIPPTCSCGGGSN